MSRFQMHDNGFDVPASLRYTIYDTREDIVIAAYMPDDQDKAIADTQMFNRLYGVTNLQLC